MSVQAPRHRKESISVDPERLTLFGLDLQGNFLTSHLVLLPPRSVLLDSSVGNQNSSANSAYNVGAAARFSFFVDVLNTKFFVPETSDLFR